MEFLNSTMNIEKLFEKFEDLWKAMLFLEKHLRTVSDAHDQKFLGYALFSARWNVEKAGLRLMQIDTDLIRLQAQEKALKLGLERLGDQVE